MNKEKGCIKELFSNGGTFVRSLYQKKTYGNKRMILNLKIKMLSINNIINLLKPN